MLFSVAIALPAGGHGNLLPFLIRIVFGKKMLGRELRCFKIKEAPFSV